ncbi:sigma-70 family RNA polymerase sigma factor [Rubrivirga sp. S365]|uniref:Sigma-70 family RNA polymerase sigma factor n=1 Tax=Rubrivirga litoralis TaxID=3075598 RepID=A0ABU3BQH0_9BACT|nr:MULTISPECIES: sigma-70 family RNA polymerase sigma factor [unclassified Rubrivirga]MDT0631532.1 sigma-70 family RNA polymerase sigma factor [Rubrivirga sp. F394]MDT7855485.1 sigma-70 family RNA polymerase sigma factor [Rubrivirga sp. S365]
MSDISFERLDAVAARLPFSVDDYGAAAAAFVRWRAGGGAADWEAAVTWAYCYSLRYLYVRFAREPAAASADVEAVVDRTFMRVLDKLDEVRDPSKFPQFVSVVCKRALLTYRERCRPTAALDEERMAAPPRPEYLDGDLVRWAVGRAVDALPPALRVVARMRLLDGAPYADVARATGHALPTVRTYLSKAVRRLRDDPHLRALAFDDVLPVGAIPEPEGGAV